MRLRLLKYFSLLLIAILVVPASAQDTADSPRQAAETAPDPDTRQPVPSRFGEKPVDEAYGAYQRGLYLTARNLAMPRAEAGDAAAQTLLAEIYSRGLGVPRDVEKAAYWYEKAAEKEVPEAQFQYALLLLKREKGSQAAKNEATLLMKAAADGGNAEAQFNYAQLLLEAQPGSSGQMAALEYFKLAAERNIADAQYALARYYLTGSGGVEVDETEARKWLARAAAMNFATAQLELGNMMLSGVGGPRDLDGGYGWIKRAAHSGHTGAQGALAKLYWGGIGVNADSTEAAAWFVLARRAGLRDRVLDDFWEGISAEVQKAAIERANRLQ